MVIVWSCTVNSPKMFNPCSESACSRSGENTTEKVLKGKRVVKVKQYGANFTSDGANVTFRRRGSL